LTKSTPQRSQKFLPSFSPDLTFSFRVCVANFQSSL
jgi:hypothetical protein